MENLPMTPIIIAAVLIAVIMIAFALIAKNYIKVSPNKAAVISGRTRKLSDGTVVGYRIVRGGATLVVPFLEKYEILDLNVMQVALVDKGFTCRRARRRQASLTSSSRARPSLRAPPGGVSRMPQISSAPRSDLEGHLPAILGTLTVEQ